MLSRQHVRARLGNVTSAPPQLRVPPQPPESPVVPDPAAEALRYTALTQRVFVAGYRDDYRAGRAPGLGAATTVLSDPGKVAAAIADRVGAPTLGQLLPETRIAHARELLQLWGRAASLWTDGDTSLADTAQTLVTRIESVLVRCYPEAYAALRESLADVLDDINDPQLLERGVPRVLCAAADAPPAAAAALPSPARGAAPRPSAGSETTSGPMASTVRLAAHWNTRSAGVTSTGGRSTP